MPTGKAIDPDRVRKTVRTWTAGAEVGAVFAVFGWVFYDPLPVWALCVYLIAGSLCFGWLLWRTKGV